MTTRAQLLHVVEWASIECEKQRSGERSVSWLVQGWARARRMRSLTRPNVEELGRIIEPRTNVHGYRVTNVRVGSDVKVHWERVPDAMGLQIAVADNLGRVNPDEWYRQFEEVHPFRDGNGRTGNVLWNWLRGTLDKPEAPPDFWSEG